MKLTYYVFVAIIILVITAGFAAFVKVETTGKASQTINEGRKIYLNANNMLLATKDSITVFRHPQFDNSIIASSDNYGVLTENFQNPFGDKNSDFLSKKTIKGIVNLGARDYNPDLSRFLVPDSLIQTEISPYNYGKNNPFKFADFDGNVETYLHGRIDVRNPIVQQFIQDYDSLPKSIQQPLDESGLKITFTDTKVYNYGSILTRSRILVEKIWDGANDIGRITDSDYNSGENEIVLPIKHLEVEDARYNLFFELGNALNEVGGKESRKLSEEFPFRQMLTIYAGNRDQTTKYYYPEMIFAYGFADYFSSEKTREELKFREPEVYYYFERLEKGNIGDPDNIDHSNQFITRLKIFSDGIQSKNNRPDLFD